jgi:hypothetical protein
MAAGKLTSRERLRRCFWHEELDRPAVYVRWGGMETNTDPTYAEMKRLVLEKTDLKVPWDASTLVEPYAQSRGAEPYDDRYDRVVKVIPTPRGDLVQKEFVGRQGQPGFFEEHFLKDVDDCEKYLRLPLPGIRADCAHFFRAVREIGERGIVDVGLPSNPAGAVVELLGSERFALMSVDERDLVHRLIERECRILCSLVRALLEKGVGPFFSFSGQEYIVPPIHGRRDFFDFNVRYDGRVTEMIHAAGGRVHVHCHGSIGTLLDGFVEFGADVLHPFEAPPMGDVSPRSAKEALGGRITFEGNIQIGDMYGAHPADIRDQVRALVRDVFHDREGLIVCPTASPWQFGAGDLCRSNYEAMIEEVLSVAAQGDRHV